MGFNPSIFQKLELKCVTVAIQGHIHLLLEPVLWKEWVMHHIICLLELMFIVTHFELRIKTYKFSYLKNSNPSSYWMAY